MLHRLLSRSLTLAFCAFVLCSALPARGQGKDSPAAKHDGDAKARAEKYFQRGITAYKEGRFKDAIDAFLDAHREYPSPTLSFNAARAYEKMGDNAGALRFYREYLRQNASASDRDAVAAKVTELEKKLQERGVQQVTVLSNVEGATVVIDDRPVGVTPWTGEILPGTHKLELRREGYDDATQSFELEAHRSLDVTLSMNVAKAAPKPEPEPVTGPAPKPMPTPDSGRGGGPSVWTWTAFGVGAAAFGGALAFELMRESAQNDVKNEPTQLARYDAYDRMQSRQTTARVLAGVGAVATIAGGVLLYFDLKRGSHQQEVGLGCGPAGCGAQFRGRF